MRRRTTPHLPPAPSPAWTAFALGLCLALSVAGFVGLFAPSLRHALDSQPHRRGIGFFWLVTALAIGLQLIYTTRRGYVYWHHTQTVMKASHSVLYRLWCVVQGLLVAMSALAAALFLR